MDRATILCIEDDSDIRELLVEVLSEANFRVEIASDGTEGLARLDHAPDLVLCDVDLPGTSGFEILESLRARQPALRDVPFLFITAFGGRENQIRAQRLGCDDYIVKPLDFELLIETIRNRLARAKGNAGEAVPIPLTDREVEALTWAARGKSSLDIALLLGVSERTVNFHIDNVLRKMQVATRTQAAVRATVLGYIKP